MEVDSAKPTLPTGGQIVRLYQPRPLARAFAVVHEQRLRYVARRRQWMAWDGTRWRPDDTGLALDLAGELCRTAADVAATEMPEKLGLRVVERLGAPTASAAVERLARTDRLLAASPEQFDAEPDLLNTPAGILDTRTGDVTPHRPEAYMTRIAAVAPADPGTPCPLWSGWLDRIAGGDADLLFYLQRVAGWALAGRDPGPALGFLSADDRRFFTSLLAHLGALADAAAPPACGDDPDFADRLEAEYPAILRWAVEGCLAWRRVGLAPPPAARAAAERRRAAEDATGRWIEESTDKSPGAWASAGALYAAWQDWAERAGVDPGSRKRFSQALEARGFAPKRRRTGQRGFAGLALRQAQGNLRPADPSSVIGEWTEPLG
ncbi:MAG: hypothetical protein L6R19_09710 [Alphaproteobacteria bacterium]|nr:hypothetical protein [Alphaproteobacteria bacterium]